MIANHTYPTAYRKALWRYRLLLVAFSPFIVGYIIAESIRRNFNLRFIAQRFGFVYPNITPHSGWLHCASVGEISSITTLASYMAEPLLITVTTSTAYHYAQQRIPQATVCALPFDWCSSINRFLQATKPKILWVVETEIWPNLFYTCTTQSIPITLINARLSQRTLSAPAWLKSLYKYSLNFTEHIYVKDAENQKKFIALGAPKERCTVLGNLKYSTLTIQKPSKSLTPFLLLASTHEPEEQQLIARCIESKLTLPIVITPRHPERANTLKKQLTQRFPNLSISVGDTPQLNNAIHIINQLGKAESLYLQAAISIMGGSFTKKGGHNILEPAASGTAVITGPNMDNFAHETSSMLASKALIQAQSYDAAIEAVMQLLENPTVMQQLQECAAQHIEEHSKHILQCYRHHLSQYLKDPVQN